MATTEPSGAPTAGVSPATTVPSDGVTTRSEERLTVQVVSVPYARAVLHIETTVEQVMVPATITRQHARLEVINLPATDSAPPPVAVPTAGRAPEGSPWVTLYVEEPVVTTRRAPVERVRIDVHQVTDEQTITDVLGREEIAVEHLTAIDQRPPVPPTAP